MAVTNLSDWMLLIVHVFPFRPLVASQPTQFLKLIKTPRPLGAVKLVVDPCGRLRLKLVVPFDVWLEVIEAPVGFDCTVIV